MCKNGDEITQNDVEGYNVGRFSQFLIEQDASHSQCRPETGDNV